ncbi:retrotransposon hot spot (RHS) protein [Trypanosoma rangeli]|uniref:Retrotransposon hot spot (RHS) protein n=1 Tax=Trypanosoma rangeli TaxID=5698 RepID=A0A3R7K219_TRYRA|nr:retrotransposon hot spot (RHS) protein [Trypanosoma rangeli]RNE99181.1 retrotransposon hot spot (RHS) protein [Trypanosoma rangeli]|eukprot:RNE99181.1 retrotransposon hot spot (RHS) protein [Trypanosoma rangeli]
MAAGSYLLCQLLHYDAGKMHVVVYCVGRILAYMFEKTTQTVAQYEGELIIRGAIIHLVRNGMKGCAIYEAAEWFHAPSEVFLPSPHLWSMIVVSPPHENNFSSWEERACAMRIIMNCPEELEVKAMCAWRMCHQPAEEQDECWRRRVQQRMDDVGPILRWIFDADAYLVRRLIAC